MAEPTLDDLPVPTRIRNCLRRAGVVFPQNMTLLELTRVQGIGPDSIRTLAIILEKHCV